MADSQPDSKVFSVRIVSIDHYMAPPIPGVDICYSSFQGEKVQEVPVIRVYGSTPAGQKTCLHVHGALPYLYIPCGDIPLQPHEEGDACTHAISFALEKALKLKSNAGSKRQHVHGCSLVRAKKFYGYHSSEELFAKINLYHPHDVTRAAYLLLGGAVLDKSLQPHESHIPFILQFLIDYNLYGMGHLHLSKVKFRSPVPDYFTTKKFHYSSQHGREMDEITRSSVDPQADSSGKGCLNSQLWLSSTIPGDWKWEFSCISDGSSSQEINCFRRQSVCELEGDAIVDDIVNQHFKMYTSLSQARSELKMVQSLVPIWEEEYERTGIHDTALPPDSGKPLPQDVLKSLSLGIGFENALMELCEGEKILSSFEKDVSVLKSVAESADEESLVELGPPGSYHRYAEHLDFKKGRNTVEFLSPQGLVIREEMDTKPSQGKEDYCKLLSEGEIKPSEVVGTLNRKATDKEALGLLKWLATSQAAEDINSEDELLRDVILSPLLPGTIDKVLEKANEEYEDESQKECQDILDSVDDVINFDGLKETPTCSVGHPNNPQTSEKKIRQVDGSSDDLQASPCAEPAENSSKVEMKSEIKKSLQHHVSPGSSRSIPHKHNVNRTVWGSLPLTEKGDNDLETKSYNITSTYLCETKDFGGTSCLVGNELRERSDACASDIKEPGTLIECSVRDLMRRKRCRRLEPPEWESHRVKRVLFKGEQNEDTSLCSDNLDSCSEHDKSAPGSSKFHQSHTNKRTTCEGDGSGPVNSDGSYIQLQSGTGFSSARKGKKEVLWFTKTRKEDSAAYVGCSEAYNGEESNSNLHPGEAIDSDDHTSDTGSLSDVQPLRLDCDIKSWAGERFQQTKANNSSCLTLSSSPAECIRVSSIGLHGKSIVEGRSSSEGIHNLLNQKLGDAATIDDPTSLQNEKSVNWRLGHDSCLSVGCSGSSTFNMEATPVDLIGMTLCKKPPSPDCKGDVVENAFCPPAIGDHFYPFHKMHHGGTLDWRAFDDVPPFFEQDCQENKEFQSNCLENIASDSHQEASLGVPTHYLNNGSCLYMLAPALSPPSVDCVDRWLLNNNEGAFAETNTAIEELSLLKGSPDSTSCSQGFLHDDCTKAVTESGSQVEPSLVEMHQETDRILDAELNPHDGRLRQIQECDGRITEVDALANYMQDASQISGPDGRSRATPLSQIGFRDPASIGAGEQLTLLSLEVQAESRGDFRPDPRYDSVNVVALALQNDDDSVVELYVLLRSNVGTVHRNIDGIPHCRVLDFSEEKHLFSHFIKILCSFDPDILMGWDIQGGSLGFLAERAAHLGIGLLNSISRTPSERKATAGDLEVSERGIPDNLRQEAALADSVIDDAIIEDEWGRTHASGVHVGGRIVLNVWRLMRGEIKLNMYTVEAVAEAVLRRKTPSIPYKVLTRWFSSGPGQARYRCIEYALGRAKLNLEIMNKLDMINRTSELARVFGIDFFSVLSRGSQYRVESMFLRLAHTQNYLAISPGNQQVASQPAMECLPLVMEPESGFYADPVVVLDFQSLYPSMIIAYNLCFCTCLGKVGPSKENILGVTSFSPDPHVLWDAKDQMLLTPNGVMYVPSEVRKGVLPRLLEEILSTRIMVKKAMKKLTPSQQVLHRIFNARQLALKLIANVTYGYTAAGFSGRMPCAELADSIVQCGRCTLERAISLVNSNEKWNAQVIYGDTDSMFVLLKGRSVKESFRIGYEIASAVTAINPHPVTLKMEKVYQPCFLLTKKRYVGYSYESPDQIEPMFDAKGIETVRRDTCSAVAKMMEQSLRLFFEHQDISQVKAYLQRQWTRILSGRVSLQDFVFAKEVRLGTYSTRSSSSLPPAAIVATKAMRADPRAEPRYGERVPYIVIHGEPGARLVDMVVDPLDLLAIDSPYRLNDLYYINKQIIPAVQRVFGLVGADLSRWFLEMPRPGREDIAKRSLFASNPQRSRIDYYYLSKHCILCGELVQALAHLCKRCSQNETIAATAITGRTSILEREMQHLAAICRHCRGGDWLVESVVKCTSLACSVFYERRKVQKELRALSSVATEKGFYPKCMVEWF